MPKPRRTADRRSVASFDDLFDAPAPGAPAYGEATASERSAADLFWTDLLGSPASPPPRRRVYPPIGSIAEASPQLSGSASPLGGIAPPPRPRPTYPGALIRQTGIDIYEENDIPSMNQIRGAGIAFVIHRCSIGNTPGNAPDARFNERYPLIRAAGLIRGSFHYYLHTAAAGGTVQGNQAAAAVQRLGPGDLAPSLDFEERAVAAGQAAPPTAAAWRRELEAFLDTIETKLGRIPLIYTRQGPWHSHLETKADFRQADFAHFGMYPLWVIHYAVRFQPRDLTFTAADGTQTTIHVVFNPDKAPKRTDVVFPAGVVGNQLFALARAEFRRQARAEADRLFRQRQAINPPANAIPRPWAANWSLFQYVPFTPESLRPHGFTTDHLIDFNVTRGGIYFLRGLADLGRTAPHLVGNLNCIAYTETDGAIHLLQYVSGSWIDQSVARDMPVAGAVPLAAGDPSAAAVGNEQVIAYRAADGRVHVLTRNIAAADARWQVTTVPGVTAAFGDPFVFVLQNTIHVVYWDDANAHVLLSRVNGVWQSASLADRPGAANTPSRISGSAIAYVHQNALHVVSRSRDAGHLFDFVAGGVAPQDLTAASHPPAGQQTPAATYRPATYTRTGQPPRIVFRALRGHIWEIERDTLTARDLSAAAAAPTAAGSPTAVFDGTAHILYRGTDGTIHEIFDDRGVFRSRRVCADAVSDPSAYVDERGHAAVTFRTANGPIRIGRFVQGQWRCEDVP